MGLQKAFIGPISYGLHGKGMQGTVKSTTIKKKHREVVFGRGCLLAGVMAAAMRATRTAAITIFRDAIEPVDTNKKLANHRI